jgi:hypothetical protein
MSKPSDKPASTPEIVSGLSGSATRSDWKLARYAVVAGIATIGFPQTVVKYPWGLPVPIQNAGALLIVLVGFGSLFASRHVVLAAFSRRVVAFLSVIAYAVVLGALQHSQANFVGHFFMREVLFLAMCCAGIAIAMTWRADRLNRLMEDVNVSASVLLLFFSVLLKLGFIGDVKVGQERLLDISLYVYNGAILVTAPIIARNSTRSKRFVALTVAFGAASVLLFSVISATRSSFLHLVVMLATVLVIAAKRYRMDFQVVAQLCGSVGLLFAAVLYFSDTAPITQRFSSTYVRDEIRFVELTDVIRQLSDWFPIGAGIGVGFETALSFETSEDRFGGLVNAPHIGVIAWTLKAGVFGLLLTVFILVRAFAWLGETGPEARTRSNFDSGLLVLTAIGASSGGWTMLELFLSGLCFARGVTSGGPTGRDRPLGAFHRPRLRLFPPPVR